jgi:hypothetical protein
MVEVVKSLVNLKCPSCGKVVITTIITAGPDRLRAASAPDGFFVLLAADNSMEIVCSDCRVTAVEAGRRASWLFTSEDKAASSAGGVAE